jgi:histidinol dehydrogenase
MFRTQGILYPALARRSGGLSLGVDLFPDGKRCNFDCPYCEVFPFRGEADFEAEALDRELETFFLTEYPAYLPEHPVRDLALSGSGEPTLSPHLEKALASMRSARDRMAPGAALVLITNATTLGSGRIAELLGTVRGRGGPAGLGQAGRRRRTAYARMRAAVPCPSVP